MSLGRHVLRRLLYSVPLMVLYFIAQRFMVTGMTSGAVKG